MPIFFVSNGDRSRVLIGYARDPQARLKQLQVASCDELQLLGAAHGGTSDKVKIHQRFAAEHVRADWFKLSGAIRQYIQEHAIRPDRVQPKPVRGPAKSPPAYRRHKPSGRAVVTLGGRDCYLGKYGSPQSRQAYDRQLAEWLANDRRVQGEERSLTIIEAIAHYWKHVKQHYVKCGRPTTEQASIKWALRYLRPLYDDTNASEFGPVALKAVRQRMIDAGLSRGVVNQNVARIRRMFRWLVSEQLIHESTWRTLTAVDGLRRGRTAARETEPVRPVDDALVDATLPHLPEVVADLIRFARLTGCRPAEACQLRPCEIDRSGDVWLYRVPEHKTSHRDRERIVAIGPQAQGVLLKYLARASDTYCFRPIDSEEKRRAAAHANRKTPLKYGNRPGTNRRRAPKRTAGQKYDAGSLRHAIHRACDRAFPPPDVIAADPVAVKLWKKEHYWSANRLRHSCATEIRKRFGLEAAGACLGHAELGVTQIYAERDQALAVRVAREIG